MISSPGPVSTALGAAAIGLAVLTLAGCAGIQNLLQHQHEETFSTYAKAQDGWVGVEVPSWIPADAVELHNLATDDESQAVIRVTTESVPVGCTETSRHGAPALTADWTSDEWPDTVLACGDYEVMGVDEGWLGWFNADHQGDSPND
ncbi:MAG: hypothetical protein ACTHKX_03905 [Pseudolysinimonas sp.]